MTKYSDILLTSLRDSAAQMTDDLRKSALDAGWPSSVASTLGIDLNGDDLRLRVDHPQIEALEYGGIDSQPSPAIRKWISADTTDTVLAASIEKNLKEAIK